MLYLLLIFFPLSMAFSAFLLRRLPRLAIALSIGTLIVELLLAVQVRVDDPVRVLGVTFLLSPLNQIFLFLFLGVGIATLTAALIVPHGENFSAIGLLTVGSNDRDSGDARFVCDRLGAGGHRPDDGAGHR